MKKYSLFLLPVLFSLSVEAQKVKIGDMPTLNAKPVSAWIPIVTGGVNRKVRADSIAALAKTDTTLIRKIAKDSIDKLVDSIAAHDTRIISLNANLDSSKDNLRTETVAAVTAVQPYKLYAAEITQVGTSTPSAMVILNQLSGAISWSRNSVGSYTGTLSGAFPGAKTYATYSSLDATDYQKRLYRFNSNSFFIEQRDFAGSSTDGFSIYIEIRIYN